MVASVRMAARVELPASSILKNTFTKREFLTWVVPAGLVAASSSYLLFKDPLLDRTLGPIEEQKQDHRRTNVGLNQYLEENESVLQRTILGCSFAPEKFFELCKEDNKNYQPNHDDALKALKVVVEELGIKNIRFGLRWSNTVGQNGNVSLKYYKPYLNYLFEKGVNLCLGLGPLRNLGWPEEHPPRTILDNLKILPQTQSKLNPEMPLAQEAFAHLNNLSEALKANYPSPDSFQAENEPFNYFYFGKKGWIAGLKYYRHVTEIIHSHFPEQGILINSTGTHDFKQIDAFLTETQRRGKIPLSTFTVGLDYYHKVEDFAQRIERISKRLLGIVDWPDIFTYSKMAPEIVGNLNFLEKAAAKGVKLEATEIQAEAWGRYKGPGELPEDLQFAYYRCAKILEPFADKTERATARIWGIERLVFLKLKGRITEKQKGILQLASTLAQ